MASLDVKTPLYNDADIKNPDAVDNLGQIVKEHIPHDEGLKGDVEALLGDTKSYTAPPGTAAEYSVATRTKLLYLGGYFMLNLLLTIYNKAVLGGVRIRPQARLFNVF